MDRYDFYLFGHILAAAIWVGAAFLLLVLTLRAERARDSAGLVKALTDAGSLGQVLFFPASLVVLVLGLLMVIDGPWRFSDLWITLALIGYGTSLAFGIGVIGPRAGRMAATIAAAGALTPAALADARRVMIALRVDVVVLGLIVSLMALKPSLSTPLTLAVICSTWLVAVGWGIVALRGVTTHYARAARAAAVA